MGSHPAVFFPGNDGQRFLGLFASIAWLMVW